MSVKLATAVGALILITAPLLSSCSSEQPVTVGDPNVTESVGQETVERPWGTVNKFPEMEKAETPSAADVTFAQEMISHHRQAVELSKNLRKHGSVDELIDASAAFIIQDQQNEITTMKAWLQAWSSTLGEIDTFDDHGHDPSSMPGMLSQARVDQIATLDDEDAEVAFLVAMIEHHEGAITMSREYLNEQENAFTLSIARHIINEQGTEIDYMQKIVQNKCKKDGPATCPGK